MIRRLWALVQKECFQLARDRRTLVALLIGPALELLLFAAAIHTDISHIRLAVADQSRSEASRAYVAALTAGGSFDVAEEAPAEAGVFAALDSGRASAGLVIPPDFAVAVARGEGRAQILVDGSASFTAQSAVAAATAISQQYAVQLAGGQQGALRAQLQVLYNPDLKDSWFITPAFIAMLLYALAEALTSLAIVRERERGTIEALLVTPVRPIELVVAKTLPSLAVTFASGLLLVGVATFGLGVPFRGDVALFLALSLIGAGCGLGLGLMISSASRTQNQAQQMHSMIMMIGLFVGGVFFPSYALPPALALLGAVFPTTYFIPVVRGMALKGAGIATLWPQALAMVALLGATQLIAARLFRQSLD